MNRNNDNPLSILLGLMAMSALIVAAIFMGKPAIRPAPQPPATAGDWEVLRLPLPPDTEPAPLPPPAEPKTEPRIEPIEAQIKPAEPKVKPAAEPESKPDSGIASRPPNKP
jgi:hypothetical protein